MVSNDLKKKKTKVNIKPEVVQNKLVLTFVLASVSILGFLYAMKNIKNTVFFIANLLPVLMILSVLGVAAAGLLFAVRTSRHIIDSDKVFTKWNVLGISIVFFVSVLYYRLVFDATMVVWGMIAATVLYFVYHIFKTDFFAFTIVTAAGILLLKMSGVNYYTSFDKVISSVCLALAILVALAAIVFAVLVVSGKGIITIGEKKFDILGKKGHIYPVIISSALTIAGGIAGFVVSSLITYIVAALLIVFLAIAVIYAIKMM